MKKLTHDKLTDLFYYNPVSGLFIRNSNRKVVGTRNKSGYLVVGIDRVTYYLHRLAWFYTHKECPKFIDHINMDKSDNRLCNLRPATKAQNAINSIWNKAASGFRGVYYQGNTSKWRVKIGDVNVGYFDTKEEAYAAYCKKAKEIYGEYARIA